MARFIKTAFLLIDRRRIARRNRNKRLITQGRGSLGKRNLIRRFCYKRRRFCHSVASAARTSETLAVYIIFRLFKGFIHRTNSIMGSKITCTVKFALIRSCRVAREGRLKRQAWTPFLSSEHIAPPPSPSSNLRSLGTLTCHRFSSSLQTVRYFDGITEENQVFARKNLVKINENFSSTSPFPLIQYRYKNEFSSSSFVRILKSCTLSSQSH